MKRKPASPAAGDYLVLLAASPGETWILEDGTRIAGFYQSFGVSAPDPRRAAAIARAALEATGERVIRTEGARRVNRAALDPRVLDRSPGRSPCVWFRGGRVLFADATLVEPER